MQPTAVIRHPNKPEIAVTIRKLTRRDIFEVIDEQNASRKVVAVYGQDGKPMLDPNGQPYTQVLAGQGSLIGASARLRKSLVKWENVVDPDGKPVAMDGNPKTALVLWDEHLDVKSEGCIFCNQTEHAEADHPFVNDLSFGAYLSDKIANDKTFDADPTQTGSA
jgi:hypothetical protein